MEDNEVSRIFRSLIEDADKKFSRVRDIPPYARAQGHAFQKVFKAYTKLWKYQQENRAELVDAGLNRWEVGEIASRIGQLYFNQYMRTSDCRFLMEAYVFYEAIVRRRYFEENVKEGKLRGKELVGLRFKELRFYARFLVVCLILGRTDAVRFLVDQFRSLVDDCKLKIREANIKEWKVVVQDIVRFLEVDTSFTLSRSLRYSVVYDVHPNSQLYVARFHSKKVQKFTDAILTSYYRNEVKFAEISLDTYRMLQCLEWESSFLKERPSEHSYIKPSTDSYNRPLVIDNSATSGAIDMHLTAEMSDPTLPPNPRKLLLFRPSVTQLLAVIATICEELPPECIMLLYLSASGNPTQCNSPIESSELKGPLTNVVPKKNNVTCTSTFEPHSNGKKDFAGYDDSYLWFGPKRNGGHNMLYPGDIIPFTRKPLFLIIDSDNSHAFKMLHGAERGEPAALLLSPLKATYKNISGGHEGSQFTFFLTSPLQAFCQMVGLLPSDDKNDDRSASEEILSAYFSEWEVTLCTSKTLDLVWAQVLSDHFLRRILLRFVFCRSALSLFRHPEDSEVHVPVCLPPLPGSLAPTSQAVQSAVVRLAKHLNVANSFCFDM